MLYMKTDKQYYGLSNVKRNQKNNPKQMQILGDPYTSHTDASIWQELYRMRQSQSLWVSMLESKQKLSRDTDREKCRTIHNMCQDAEDREVSTKYFDRVRSKTFNFYSVRSVIITKLRLRNNKNILMCKCKINTGSDSNLMPIKMFKVLFHTPNTWFKQDHMQKNILHAYNNWTMQGHHAE